MQSAKKCRKCIEKWQRTRLAKAKPINKEFNRRARANQQRTEAIMKDKED